MLNNFIDNGGYSENSEVFALFNHFSLLNTPSAHIKLICYVVCFHLLMSERGGY
jgi:hypothetical protein